MTLQKKSGILKEKNDSAKGVIPMKYILMHRKKEVAELEIDDITGFILKVSNVYVPDHLPIGISFKNGIADRAALNDWWTDRSIPASRSGVRNALELLEVANTKMLLVKCFGLSLSDQYWIRSADLDIVWEDINFFDNEFSEDIGDALFGKAKKDKNFDFSSPDNTSDGCLKKRWKIINGKRCLIKGGSNLERQQPFNEVIATKIMEMLDIPHVPYELMWDNGEPYSVCEDFVDSNADLVSAWRIMQIQKKDNNTSVYNHFINCCEALGIKNVKPALDRMITLDYIIANEDRHLNNFGVLRNAETLEWIGFAPIYDSGSSLGYDKRVSQIIRQSDIVCKPFKKTHDEQIKLVNDFSWIDIGNLRNIDQAICEVYDDENVKEFIDETRASAITEAAMKRINVLEDIIFANIFSDDTVDGDVEENIAADYTQKFDM